ncbi:hypothetical protein KIH86_27990 [Paenibacillus sp. HN-1]|uniref:hypothetical protein n=1 Tax=Paenibacillus TaxID=44249 RepID=UPI001CA94CB1|nr:MULTISPECIES: hypothetical protein [Paenibacillus]MBY9078803.1 hypothetical protein [Paenibacillus sp. CGMCC 1.18879]MBY9088037.1 hypothetical protein [Paenibacillus sinensis]
MQSKARPLRRSRAIPEGRAAGKRVVCDYATAGAPHESVPSPPPGRAAGEKDRLIHSQSFTQVLNRHSFANLGCPEGRALGVLPGGED